MSTDAEPIRNRYGCLAGSTGENCIEHQEGDHCNTECPNFAAPELPPIIATVKAGDTLIFLMPEIKDLKAIRYAEQILNSRYPGIKCTVEPAVGVVHLPTPEPRPKICAHTYQPANMRGFYVCRLAPGHNEDHDSEPTKPQSVKWPLEPWQ